MFDEYQAYVLLESYLPYWNGGCYREGPPENSRRWVSVTFIINEYRKSPWLSWVWSSHWSWHYFIYKKLNSRKQSSWKPTTQQHNSIAERRNEVRQTSCHWWKYIPKHTRAGDKPNSESEAASDLNPRMLRSLNEKIGHFVKMKLSQLTQWSEKYSTVISRMLWESRTAGEPRTKPSWRTNSENSNGVGYKSIFQEMPQQSND